MKLRRVVFSLLAPALALPMLATAAEHSNVGVLVGPDFVSNSSPLSDTATHFTGGLLYEHVLMPQFSIQPELRYTNKSVGSASYDMLTLPVMFKGHIPTNTFVTPNVAVGPDFNFKLSGPNGVRTFLFAFDFGAGADFDVLPSTALSFDFRYALGLMDEVSGFDSKPREVELLFGVKFRI
jgi:hypothetical protein